MTFNSLGFAILFIVVFILYYSPISKTPFRRNLLLFIASYVFYGMWDWRFLGLIIFTTLTTFFAGQYLCFHKSKPVATVNILLNLAILITFKYFNFFSENFAHLFALFGFTLDWVFLDVLLPVGISFYTFQAIGYTVDAYRGELKGLPTNDLLLFSTFIAYFPQLVAGPIERASNIMPQLARASRWDYEECVKGLRRVLWGLLKKVVVADQCGLLVDRLWNNGLDVPYGSIKIFVATLLFTVQIYCDFSGYCDIALGISRILGIRLTENFTRPYFRKSVLSFWHHWHISLMDWFTHYVYIPLGGSRKGNFRHYLNIFIVFFLSGLWHGASWTFVLWGTYWAVVYAIAIALNIPSYKKETYISEFSVIQIISTLSFVVIGWAIFRSSTPGECWSYLIRSVIPLTAITAVIACGGGLIIKRLRLSAKHLMLICIAAFVAIMYLRPVIAMTYYFLPYIAIVFLGEWITRNDTENLYPLPAKRIWRYALYIFLYVSILSAPLSDSNFIYFQF